MTRLGIGILFACFLGLMACGNSETADPLVQRGQLFYVVTTVSPITSIVENVGGTRIRLEGIVPEGVNSHTFAPTPSVAKAIASADLIILNGLFLEEPTRALAVANKKTSARILSLAEEVLSEEQWIFDFSFPKSGNFPNPHLWTSPPLALSYAELVLDALIVLDPEGESYYRGNFARLEARLEDLDQRIVATIQTIPQQNRKLLTYHDSFPFFALRYGLEIIGAVQPSNFSEPSAREVAALIEQVRTEKVPVIFGSMAFPSDVMEQIAKEADVRFVDQLRDDDLPGVPGDQDHTYLGLILANIEIMAPALGGNIEALKGFDPSPVFEGQSTARYP